MHQQSVWLKEIFLDGNGEGGEGGKRKGQNGSRSSDQSLNALT